MVYLVEISAIFKGNTTFEKSSLLSVHIAPSDMRSTQNSKGKKEKKMLLGGKFYPFLIDLS